MLKALYYCQFNLKAFSAIFLDIFGYFRKKALKTKMIIKLLNRKSDTTKWRCTILCHIPQLPKHAKRERVNPPCDYTTLSWSYRQRKLQIALSAFSTRCSFVTWSFDFGERIEKYLPHNTTQRRLVFVFSFVFEFSIRLDRSVERLRWFFAKKNIKSEKGERQRNAIHKKETEKQYKETKAKKKL